LLMVQVMLPGTFGNGSKKLSRNSEFV